MPPYTESFYRKHSEGSRQSAKAIVPLVLELTKARSVIDLGCGVGGWLAVFKEFGIEDFLGVDGDYVDSTMLEIPPERFVPFDLTKPFRINKYFDLVVSLEVAEHLPRESAETFVDSLTSLGPLVLFSAAIPFQGGTDHVNEQWPDYWARLFHERGYAVIDCIRKKVWQNEDVEYWYAQNTLLFVRLDYLGNHPLLRSEFERTSPSQLSMVHPKQYLEAAGWMNRLYLMTDDIRTMIPPQDTLVLADQGQLGTVITGRHHILPFPERDGQYWGPPEDDDTAIQELGRLRRSGARFMAFAWPAFWWLDYYSEFHRHLRSEFRCVLQNDRLVVFDLRP